MRETGGGVETCWSDGRKVGLGDRRSHGGYGLVGGGVPEGREGCEDCERLGHLYKNMSYSQQKSCFRHKC